MSYPTGINNQNNKDNNDKKNEKLECPNAPKIAIKPLKKNTIY